VAIARGIHGQSLWITQGWSDYREAAEGPKGERQTAKCEWKKTVLSCCCQVSGGRLAVVALIAYRD
jgi:hypothetical protein